MFNDVLTKEECQRLVEGVAETVFPFMCAHGRNSMVPLVYLDGEIEGDQRRVEEGGIQGGFGANEERGEEFGAAYRKWRNKAAAGV
jgi:DNA mismatch repair protein MLH3